jgi:hypothetical protein
MRQFVQCITENNEAGIWFHPFLTGKVGIALNGEWYEPKTHSQEDKQAAEMAMQFVVSKH